MFCKGLVTSFNAYIPQRLMARHEGLKSMGKVTILKLVILEFLTIALLCQSRSLVCQIQFSQSDQDQIDALKTDLNMNLPRIRKDHWP